MKTRIIHDEEDDSCRPMPRRSNPVRHPIATGASPGPYGLHARRRLTAATTPIVVED